MSAAKESCLHTHLTLLPRREKRLRCRHCHLTIKADELQDGFCPECYERSGRKRYDFETVASETDGKAVYRCEDCGAIIETGGGAQKPGQ